MFSTICNIVSDISLLLLYVWTFLGTHMTSAWSLLGKPGVIGASCDVDERSSSTTTSPHVAVMQASPHIRRVIGYYGTKL
jgi:hypothetical protein